MKLSISNDWTRASSCRNFDNNMRSVIGSARHLLIRIKVASRGAGDNNNNREIVCCIISLLRISDLLLAIDCDQRQLWRLADGFQSSSQQTLPVIMTQFTGGRGSNDSCVVARVRRLCVMIIVIMVMFTHREQSRSPVTS